MKKSKNSIFCMFAVFVFLVIVMLGMIFVHVRMNLFERNAKTYIGKTMSEAWNDLKLERRRKLFQWVGLDHYIVIVASTYQKLSASDFRAGVWECVDCYWNGSKSVCFLFEQETGLMTDCYTTKPLPKYFSGDDFIGQPCEALYEKFGRPASDGKFGGENGEYRVIRYLKKGTFFLSFYIKDFHIDDDGVIEKIEYLLTFH